MRLDSHARDSVAIFICGNITEYLHQNRYAPRHASVNTLAPKTITPKIIAPETSLTYMRLHCQCRYGSEGVVSGEVVSESIKTITNKNKQKGYRRAV